MRGVTSAVLLAVSVAAVPAAADLYRCKDADGKVRYTDDASLCPGAAPHEPKGNIQRIESVAPSPTPPASGGSFEASEQALEAHEAAWRGKLQQARQERDALSKEVEQLEDLAGWCNRGGTVGHRDESGIFEKGSCDEVRASLQQKQGRFKQVQAYLREGIYEECRKAGCLPGWLR